MPEPRTTIGVTLETMELLERWKHRIEEERGLPEQSWDQFLSMVARTVVPA